MVCFVGRKFFLMYVDIRKKNIDLFGRDRNCLKSVEIYVKVKIFSEI